jgi:hypothetical protein
LRTYIRSATVDERLARAIVREMTATGGVRLERVVFLPRTPPFDEKVDATDAVLADLGWDGSGSDDDDDDDNKEVGFNGGGI